MKIYDDYRQRKGTLISRLNADIVHYIDPKLIEEDPSDSEDSNSILRKTGFRIYYDGKTSIWSRSGAVSVHYMIGFGQHICKIDSFTIIAGFGFGYSFSI